MQLIIRDDDLSFFSNPKKLKSYYQDIWDKIPIHFATIPRVGNVKGITPSEFLEEDKIYPIDQNQPLITMLKQKIKEGKVKIWQHGFTHKNYGQKFELERTSDHQLWGDLKIGKDLLEKTFAVNIDTLVAPHDRFSKEAIKAAEYLGYKYLCRGLAPLPREIRWRDKRHRQNYFKLLRFYLRNGKGLRFPQILDFGGHQEIYSYRIGMINQQDFHKILNLHQGGVLCITVHHRMLNAEQIKVLKLIISKTP